MSKRFLIIGTLIAVLLQTAVLGKIITDRANALEAGQEVLLETGFIDPRDLFRGHYTTLNFMIETINRDSVTVDGTFTYNQDVYVELDTSAEFATAKRLTATYPTNATGPVILAQARTPISEAQLQIRLRVPFKRFYAAKNRALELQNMQRERKLGVILSVANDGSAMIKGLTIEGEKIYEEPLY